jgi:thiol-disulfide isomerase/thioredoxin
MTTGTWVLLAAVVAALVLGGLRLLTDGRFRGTHRLSAAPTDQRGDESDARTSEPTTTTWTHVADAAPSARPGDRATLVQFSSAFCAPCRATRRTLAEVAAVVPGVEHVEIDAEQHLELVRRLGIVRTPTTLVLDASGHEVTRAAGAPRKEQVLRALAAERGTTT